MNRIKHSEKIGQMKAAARPAGPVIGRHGVGRSDRRSQGLALCVASLLSLICSTISWKRQGPTTTAQHHVTYGHENTTIFLNMSLISPGFSVHDA